MRAFILTLALSLPLGLAACQSEQADAIEDQGDAIEDSYDEQADMVDLVIEDTPSPADSADVIGDGEIIDEPGEPDADALGQ